MRGERSVAAQGELVHYFRVVDFANLTAVTADEVNVIALIALILLLALSETLVGENAGLAEEGECGIDRHSAHVESVLFEFTIQLLSPEVLTHGEGNVENLEAFGSKPFFMAPQKVFKTLSGGDFVFISHYRQLKVARRARGRVMRLQR